MVAMAVATGEVDTTWLLLLRERLVLPTMARREGEPGPPEVVMEEAGTATGGREATRVEAEVARFSAGSVVHSVKGPGKCEFRARSRAVAGWSWWGSKSKSKRVDGLYSRKLGAHLRRTRALLLLQRRQRQIQARRRWPQGRG